MKIAIPVSQIRAMDRIIQSGTGGYSSRAEFIVDAIEERLLELVVGPAIDADSPLDLDAIQLRGLEPTTTEVAGPASPQEVEVPAPQRAASLPMTGIQAIEPGFAIDESDDLSVPKDEQLFGLHNRDYPSIWALSRLAAMTPKGPVDFEAYINGVLRDAWAFGNLLLELEKHSDKKYSALFPTNREKGRSAEAAFRTFAIGDYRPGLPERLSTTGPLFCWRVAGLCGELTRPSIGVTRYGWQMLTALSGISVEQPHDQAQTDAFMSHLNRHAPADRDGFTQIVKMIGPAGATREEVLALAERAWPSISAKNASTQAQGYIARAREWGFIEPKQIKGYYHLTELGREELDVITYGGQR